MKSWTEFYPYKSIELQKLIFGLEIYIAREESDKFDHYLGYRIRGYVWSQDAGKSVSFKYPSDWWNAFKERWFKGWLLKKYPVKYTYKEFQVKATYPELNIQGHHPIMRLIESTWSGEDYL